jgi:hypothetical protein
MARGFNLLTVRARIDRLATAAQADCGRSHMRITHQLPDEPVPPPQAEAGASPRCTCGAAIQSIRIIHEVPEGGEPCEV